MKHQFVETLQEGDQINDCFIAVRKDLRDQARGGKFLGMVFRDRTGEIGGVMWNNAVSVARLFNVGDIVQVRGVVQSYQDRLQLRVEQVLPLRDEEYDLADLVFEPDGVDEWWTQFTELLNSVQNPYLKQLVDAYLDDMEFVERFKGAAAGKRWHHGYRGGLLQHCLEMALLADATCRIWPNLDRDLLLVAVLVHDIGKLDELTDDLYVEYTTEGKLVGHLTQGALDVAKRIDGIDNFPDKLRMHILHCIMSHHGSRENGSPVEPRSLEAMALHHIDNLGAQLNATERIADEARQQDKVWSDYQPLIGREIWTQSD